MSRGVLVGLTQNPLYDKRNTLETLLNGLLHKRRGNQRLTHKLRIFFTLFSHGGSPSRSRDEPETHIISY